MAKKLTLLMASIAVGALAVPALANAAVLTDPINTAVPIGTLLEGTSVDAVTTTSQGNLTCELVTVTGKVTVNNGATVKGIGKGTSTGTTCFLGGTKPITITNITLNEIHSGTAGSGTINVTFVADLPNNVTCHFESPNM